MSVRVHGVGVKGDMKKLEVAGEKEVGWVGPAKVPRQVLEVFPCHLM